MNKRIIAMLIAVCMLICMLPISALAEGTGGTDPEVCTMDEHCSLREGHSTGCPKAVQPVADQESAVAKVVTAANETTYHETLQAAVDAAGATDVVWLLKDTAEAEVVVADAKVVTVDLGGFQLTGSFWVNGHLTVQNGSILNESYISCIEINNIEAADGASGTFTPELTLINVKATSNRHAIRIDGGTATFESGEYTCTAASATHHAVNISGGANVTIKGGTYIGNGLKGGCAAVAVRGDGGTLTISGGEFKNPNGSHTLALWGGIIKITGGKFHKAGDDTLNLGGVDSPNGTGDLQGIEGGSFEEAPDVELLAQGKASQKGEDGWYTITSAEAKIVGKGNYLTVEEAIAAATSGQTVELLASAVVEAPIVIEQNLTLDLSSCSLTGPAGTTPLISVKSGKKLHIAGSGSISAQVPLAAEETAQVTKAAELEIAAPAGYAWAAGTTLGKVVATIDNTGYATLKEAIAASSADKEKPTTIIVEADIQLPEVTDIGVQNGAAKYIILKSESESTIRTISPVATNFNTTNSAFALLRVMNGELTLQNITISGGNTYRTVYTEKGAVLNIQSGATLTNGKKTGGNGGALQNYGTTYMTDGLITNSTAGYYGGAVCTDGLFSMTGGTITNCTADYWGAAIHLRAGQLDLLGGTITNNKELDKAANDNAKVAVFVQNATTVRFGGDMTISDNKDSAGKTIGVGFKDGYTASVTFKLASALTGSIDLELDNGSSAISSIVGDNYTVQASDVAAFKPTSDKYIPYMVAGENEITCAAAVTVTFHANDGTGKSVTQRLPKGVETALQANTFTREGCSFNGWMKKGEETVIYTDAAKVTLDADVELEANWTLDQPTVAVEADATSILANTGVAKLTATPAHAATGVTYTYQWYLNDTAISGATEKTYQVENVSATGLYAYTCEVTASKDGLTSEAVKAEAVSIRVSAAQGSITAAQTAISATYGDADQTFTFTTNITGEITVTSSDEKVAKVTRQDDTVTVAFEGAGTARITIAHAGSDDYTAAEATVEVTVAPKELRATGIAAVNRDYDGTKVVALTGGRLMDMIESGDDVALRVPATGTVASADVGEDQLVTATGVELTGAAAANYKLVQINAVTVDIAPVKLTATYVGETIKLGEVPALKVEVTGFIAGESANNAKNYAAPTVSNSHVAPGVYQLSPSGGDAANYYFEYVSGKLEILQTTVPVPSGDVVRYVVEHYKAGTNGYTLAEREMPTGKIGEDAKAVAKAYNGFVLNTEKSVLSGKLKAIASEADVVVLKLYYDEISYAIIEGAAQEISAAEPARFRSDAAFAKFVEVRLDGKVLSEEYYDVWEGSTVVELKAAFVSTLSEGAHTLTIVSTDGEASTAFTVVSEEGSENKPGVDETGDHSKPALWIALCALSAMAGMTVVLRKRRNAA